MTNDEYAGFVAPKPMSTSLNPLAVLRVNIAAALLASWMRDNFGPDDSHDRKECRRALHLASILIDEASR